MLQIGTKSPQTGAAKSRWSSTGGERKEYEPKGKRAGQKRSFVDELKNHKGLISLTKTSIILIII